MISVHRRAWLALAAILVTAEESNASIVDHWNQIETPIEWIAFPGGQFLMGGESGSPDAMPVRTVTIKSFSMSKAPVTVAQYAQCWFQGRCEAPREGAFCNWNVPARQSHPINCVDRDMAEQYARFIGARLPSEAEWEYAATGGGKMQNYPWGDEEATCERAVIMLDRVRGGCHLGTPGTLPVCSKPAGNTAHGLCDMAGNVAQWVQDNYRPSYVDLPADGSAFMGLSYPPRRIARGGSYIEWRARYLRVDWRMAITAFDEKGDAFGFRVAR